MGTGDIDFSSIRDALASEDYQRHIVLEVFSDDPVKDLANSRERVRNLGGTFAQY